jgi:hypothetical protein
MTATIAVSMPNDVLRELPLTDKPLRQASEPAPVNRLRDGSRTRVRAEAAR